MFEKVKIITSSGGKTNSDCYGFTDTAAWVIDGTSNSYVGKNNRTKTRSDIQWCAKWWSDYFYNNIHTFDKYTDLLECGAAMLFNTFDNFEKGAIPPSVSVVLLKDMGSVIKIGLLGDCGAIVKFKDQKVVYFVDQNNDMLIEDLMEKAESVKENLRVLANSPTVGSDSEMDGILISDTKALFNTRRIIEKDMKALIEGSNPRCRFHLLRADNSSVADLQTLMIQKDLVESVCLISDGMAQYFNLFKIGSVEDFMSLATSVYFTKSVDIISEYENSDLDCEKYPRLNVANDKTLLCFDIGRC